MNKPILNLRESANLSKTTRRETVWVGGTKYLYIVFKTTEGTYGWYWHDCYEPYAIHDFAQGFETEQEAYDEVISIVKSNCEL